MDSEKTKGFHRIGDIIGTVIETYRREPEGELVRIWDLWEEVVGQMVAEHTRPEAFKGKLLLVTVTNSTWIHHLQFLKRGIIDAVNQAYGRTVLDDIRFKLGSLGDGGDR